MPLSVFRIFSFEEFNNYLRQTVFQRRISVVQNHHTWKPNYESFNSNPNHLMHLESMRRDHITRRGWNDIGQNLTIFPDGKIGLCRGIDITPAGIFGANTGAICIENLGDFDIGKDVMTDEQKDAIVKTNAALCIKFGLKPLTHQVVYHHWYDRAGRRFSTADVDGGKVRKNELQKLCPGTNFFRGPNTEFGNTVQSALDHFYPLVAEAMLQLQHEPLQDIRAVMKTITANTLNVRSGPGTDFSVVRQLRKKGQQIQVFGEQIAQLHGSTGKWSRISVNSEEWVSSQFLS